MHALGPYAIPNVSAEAHLVYTNHQPSGSVRAPTAPQCCWAVESHTDEIAAAVGHRSGRVAPHATRRQRTHRTERSGVRRDRGARVHRGRDRLAGYGAATPDDEAIGVAIGWWPSFSAPRRRVREDRCRRHRADHHRRPGVRHRRSHDPAPTGRRELGIDPEKFEIIYQDTSVAPFDIGATGSQTLFNNGRAVVAAAVQVADQLKRAGRRPSRGRPGRHRARRRDGVGRRLARRSAWPSTSWPPKPPEASCCSVTARALHRVRRVGGVVLCRRCRHGRLGRPPVQLSCGSRPARP